MKTDVLFGIGVIIVLGVGLQWLARRLKFPSIILLLAGGLLVGPIFDLVEPDRILGPALFPVVSLAVGLLLFVGGLELRFSELGAAVALTLGGASFREGRLLFGNEEPKDVAPLSQSYLH